MPGLYTNVDEKNPTSREAEVCEEKMKAIFEKFIGELKGYYYWLPANSNDVSVQYKGEGTKYAECSKMFKEMIEDFYYDVE